MFRTVGKRTKVDHSVQKEKSSAGNALNQKANRLNNLLKRSGKKRKNQLNIDVQLLLIVITLIIFGLVMVYSASYDYSLNWYGNATEIFYRQLVWMTIGIGFAVVLVFIDYHEYKKYAVLAMAITVLALIGVLIANEVRNGAVRTLWGGSIQPSEMAKLVTIVYLAVWLSAKRDKLSNVSFGLIPLAVILGLFGGLILIQPDFSAVITIFILGGLLFFLAGGDLKQIVILLLVALLIGWGITQLSSTGAERIDHYLAGLKDPTQGSYHVRRSLEAIVKGGWFGVGIGEAETKLTGLPVPPTDSIFAVVGEETGVVGSAFVVCLFGLLLWRGLIIARQAPDELGSLLAAGLSLWIAVEVFINMAVMVNLLPFAGNALPFISAGGSNLTVTLFAIGILLNISRVTVQNKEDRGSLYNAVVDLRRRDGRRSIPRNRRASSRNKKVH